MKEIIGDYFAFFNLQAERLKAVGIDLSGYTVSHLAYRTSTYEEYLDLRSSIEKYCISNVENTWNGRPISKLLLHGPLDLGNGFENSLIELIPPVHQNLYKMGLEHIGIVVGEEVDHFSQQHRSALSGQQFQSPICEPYFIRFKDHTMVKFYRYSLMDVCIHEGRSFVGFHHVLSRDS